MINPITEGRFFVITGGPGSGKTTLIEALASQGLTRSIEAGRAIIREQVAIGGDAVPWADRGAFAELMFNREMRSYHWAREIKGPVIFDRGIPDVIGYLTLEKLPVPEYMDNAARQFRYHGNVFIAPPWPEIFGQDTERKQTFEEARATHDVMAETYAAYGYSLVPLPLGSVEERVKFVVEYIGVSFL
jgi:predicted ATPase